MRTSNALILCLLLVVFSTPSWAADDTVLDQNAVVHVAVAGAAAGQHPYNAAVNPVLHDGDTIQVPSVPKPPVYTATGAVLRPSEYTYTIPPPTFADALARTGGWADRARKSEVTIIHTSAAGQVTARQVDFSNPETQGKYIIQPGDNINIPQGQPSLGYDPLWAISSELGLLVTVTRELRSLPPSKSGNRRVQFRQQSVSRRRYQP